VQAPPCPAYFYIDTETALQDLVTRMGRARKIALDTEADSLYHYFEKVCLIQLSFRGQAFIVDPLAGLDLSRFLHELSRRALILHGGEFDLRMLRSSYGFRPLNKVFDTMIAAQLLGYEELSLAALAKKYVNVDLPKRGKKSNWSARPLSEAQLVYASNDTRYLHEIADQLFSELEQVGRMSWYRQSCEAMVGATGQDRQPRDPDMLWRIKGLRALDRRQLAYVKQIWHWREKEAQRADLPPFKIMGNNLILDLARYAAAHPNGLFTNGPRLPRHFTTRRLHGLQRVLERVRRQPESRWPEHRRGRPRPSSSRLLEALKHECARIAEELGIMPSVLASRATLEEVAAKRPMSIREMLETTPMLRWQAKLLVMGFRQIFKQFEEEKASQ
jgi:ribonuclease D